MCPVFLLWFCSADVSSTAIYRIYSLRFCFLRLITTFSPKIKIDLSCYDKRNGHIGNNIAYNFIV